MSKLRHLLSLIRKYPRGFTVFLREEFDRRGLKICRMARYYRRFLLRSTRVFTVVGSLGKTTTHRTLQVALNCPDRNFSYSNYGGSLGANLMRIRPWDRHGVLEVGLSGYGGMQPYAEMITPDLVVLTTIKHEHCDAFPSLLHTRAEKVKMITHLPREGVVLVNGDDPHIRWMGTQTKARIITYGLDPTNDVHASNVSTFQDRTKYDINADGQSFPFISPLIGAHMIYPVLAAFATARHEKIDSATILQRLSLLTPPPSRMEIINLPRNIRLIDDSSKSGLDSVLAAFETMALTEASRKIVVLGQVTGAPGRSGDVYRDLGERLAGFADLVFCIGGDMMRGIRAGASRAGMPRENIVWQGSRIDNVLSQIEKAIQPGDLVLIKGGITQRFRRITLHLSGREVSCSVKNCSVKINKCDHCPMLGAKRDDFCNPLINRLVDF